MYKYCFYYFTQCLTNSTRKPSMNLKIVNELKI